MKRNTVSLVSLVIREIQIIATVSCHLPLAKIIKIENLYCFGENVEEPETLICCLWECKILCNHLRKLVVSYPLTQQSHS